MALWIEATDGVSVQRRKLKDHVSLDRAIEIARDRAENDYLGLDFFVVDECGNELFSVCYEG